MVSSSLVGSKLMLTMGALNYARSLPDQNFQHVLVNLFTRAWQLENPKERELVSVNCGDVGILPWLCGWSRRKQTWPCVWELVGWWDRHQGDTCNTEVGKGKCPKGRCTLPPLGKRISGGRGTFPIKLLEGPLCRDDM